MKIIVSIKQVPDTSGKVAVNPDGTLNRASMQTITNPDDMNALEAALKIKDATGCKVVVVTMGPPPAAGMLREALAMGADEAVLVSAREFGGSDTYATSQILAAAINKIGVEADDIVMCGRQAIDGDTAQVGPQIAEHLGIPQVSYVEEIQEITDRYMVVKRQFEDRYQVVEVAFPCLITTLSELNDPRYMSVGGVFDAYQKEVRVMSYADIADVVDESNIGLKGSPTRVKQSFTKQAKGKGELHEVSADEAVKLIVEKLAAKYII